MALLCRHFAGVTIVRLLVLLAASVHVGCMGQKHSRFQVSGDLIQLAEEPRLRLNAKGGELKPGDPLILWPCSAHGHEVFNITGDGLIRLAWNPSLCLNSEGGVGAGARIITYPCAARGEPDANEDFEFREDGTIRPKRNSSMCLNVRAGKMVQGGEIILYPCADAPKANEVFVYKDGLIQLKEMPDLHFNVKGGVFDKPGHEIVLWGCQPGLNEGFAFHANDTLQLTTRRGLCVNAEAGLSPGHRLILWHCSEDGDAANEKFRYNPVTKAIYSVVKPELGFNVKEAALRAGAEIILWKLDREEL